MIHQVLGGAEGQASDVEIRVKHMLKLKQTSEHDSVEAHGQAGGTGGKDATATISCPPTKRKPTASWITSCNRGRKFPAALRQARWWYELSDKPGFRQTAAASIMRPIITAIRFRHELVEMHIKSGLRAQMKFDMIERTAARLPKASRRCIPLHRIFPARKFLRVFSKQVGFQVHRVAKFFFAQRRDDKVCGMIQMRKTFFADARDRQADAVNRNRPFSTT